MEKFYEIEIKDIEKYKNSFDLFSEGTLAAARSNNNIENALTIGWGALGILWRKPCCTIYINKKRYSKSIFDNASGFSVSFFDEASKEPLMNYYGKLSGRDVDKMNEGPFKVIHDQETGIPYFDNASLVIICEKMASSDFDINLINENNIVEWYKRDGVHTIYYGKIIKVLKNTSFSIKIPIN